VKKEMLNATKQLEAYLSVQSAMSGGEVLPDMHGWPISPDFAAHLVNIIRLRPYDVIIEMGSGTSTVIIASVLANLKRSNRFNREVQQIAIEHSENYLEKTRALLSEYNLEQSVKLIYAPLAPYTDKYGDNYQYYSCGAALTRLRQEAELKPTRVLLIVDGPPGATCKNARYPAYSVVMEAIRPEGIDILLDDYYRPDERETILKWLADIDLSGATYSSEELEFEKGGYFISVQAVT
jgi:hypothetical protein